MVPVVKKLPANAGYAGDVGSIPGLGKISWRRTWQPAPVFLFGEYLGQRNLVGYNPWRSDLACTYPGYVVYSFL